MKIIFRWCGMALAFGLSSVGPTTLNLRLDPDRRMLLAGKDQEVVVKIDLDSETGRRSNRSPFNIAVVIDHSGSMAGAKIEKTKQAAMQLIDQLTPQDTLALIEFDDRGGRRLQRRSDGRSRRSERCQLLLCPGCRKASGS